MWSVADLLQAEDRDALRGLTPAERVALALMLGARDLESFRLSRRPPLEPAQAAQVLERRRQASRRVSRCIDELIG